MSELTTEQIAEIRARIENIRKHEPDSDERDDAWDDLYSYAYEDIDALIAALEAEQHDNERLRAEADKREAELATQARYLIEFVDAMWKASGITGDWQTVPYATEVIKGRVEALREKMAWLGKGKMRPLEQRYQAFLRHDAEHGYDDTPPDYVEWLEQIAMGDIHLVDRQDCD